MTVVSMGYHCTSNTSKERILSKYIIMATKATAVLGSRMTNVNGGGDRMLTGLESEEKRVTSVNPSN